MRKLYLCEVVDVRDVGVRRKVLRVSMRVLRPLMFNADGVVVNTRNVHNASVFERVLEKSRTLVCNLEHAGKPGVYYVNKPIVPMSVSAWDSLVVLMNEIEAVLVDYCKQYGFVLIPSRHYTERSFRAWFIKMPNGGVRVGCPFLVWNRAFWITAVKHGVDITEKTRKEVNAWVKYAPKYRVYHSNKAIMKKLLEVVDYYRRKIM